MRRVGKAVWREARRSCGGTNLNGMTAKQMGPALLPTPLSPARGRCGFARLSANRPSCFSCSALGARCPCRVRQCAPAFAIPHRLVSRFVTGARTGIRLCFPVCFLSSRRNVPLGCQAFWQNRDRDPSGWRFKHPISRLLEPFSGAITSRYRGLYR